MSNQKELLSEFTIPTYEEWRKAAEDALKGVPFEKKLITKTYENIDLQPIYTESDRKKVAYLAESLPGKYPYARGICASGYKGKSWDISQAFSYPTPTMLNAALKEDLKRGQTGITISPCNCRAIYDKCDCKYEWDDMVCSGVQINDIKDFEDLFGGIDITQYSIKFLQTCPVPYSVLLAPLFLAYCKKHKIKTADLRVNFGFDITPFLVRWGYLSTPFEALMDDMASLVKLANTSGEKFSAIAIDGCTYHNSGANATQEIAYSVATGVCYIKELMSRGLNIDEIAKNIQFNFSTGVKFFIEIAKLRAARVVWAKIIHSFGGNEESQKMRINAFTSKIDKTKFDPYVNILRGTTEGLAAVLAGANSLNVGTFDEELGMPSDSSRRIARNVQCILKEESHLIDTIDPAGGSYYIETLTDKFITESWNAFREIEKIGCVFEALKTGKIQSDVAAVVAKRNQNIAFRKDVILGTNKYPNLIEKPVNDLVIVNKEVPKKHIEEVRKRKKDVDGKSIWATKWEDRADKITDTFINGAILADIWLAREQKDEKEWCKPIPAFRASGLFESLREASEKYKANTGKSPQIYFEGFGTLKQYKPRVDFSTDFYAVAGFEIIYGQGYSTAEEAIKNIGSINAPIVVICSADDIYPEVVPAYATAIKKQKPNVKLIVAGMQKDDVTASFKAAGVDDFIHIKSNVYETLAGLLKGIGVL